MGAKPSYVGPGILKVAGINKVRRHTTSPRKGTILVTMVVSALLFSVLAYVGYAPKSNNSSESLSVTVLVGLGLSYQYHDTIMACIAPPPHPLGPHAWNDSSGIDGRYGNADDCPHCSAYCAPASIQMIALYRNIPIPRYLEDFIYDNGKSVPPEITGDGTIQTHGVGMFHGVGGQPAEVQTAMTWSLGLITQHDWNPVNPKGPMTYPLLLGYMSAGTPILWLDNGGWPVNQSAAYPPLSSRMDQGHAKVIGGHDDNNTPLDPTDDLCLIYDPWPEYNDLGIVPLNCTRSAGGVCDPYWQPLNDINFSDLNDVYLVDTFPVIPEFSSVLIPVVGAIAIVAVAFGMRRKDNE